MFRELVVRMVAKWGTISPLLTENSELDQLLFSLRGRKCLCPGLWLSLHLRPARPEATRPIQLAKLHDHASTVTCQPKRHEGMAESYQRKHSRR